MSYQKKTEAISTKMINKKFNKWIYNSSPGKYFSSGTLQNH